MDTGISVISDFNIADIRAEFPLLTQEIHGHSVVYLDNAATTQMPKVVMDAFASHYSHDNANVHRGIHTLSERSTSAFEEARKKVQTFIGARVPEEIVFTSGTTASINLVAQLMEQRLGPNQVVVSTMLEHHANFVPWQQLCLRKGASFVACGLTPEGDIDLDELDRILSSSSVAIVAVAHVSNVLGTVSPIKRIVEMAHSAGALVLVDAAQSIRHEIIDVDDIGCDFLAFSGHKVLGPSGIGVLYGRAELLEDFLPVSYGGEMVDTVRVDATSFERSPLRYEAGTPNYSGAIMLGVALDYIDDIGREWICERERMLTRYSRELLCAIDGLHIIGSPAQSCGCSSFVIDDVHPFDLASFIDKLGYALRSGNQCAQPLLHEFYGIANVCRLSPAFYNTKKEIADCCLTVEKISRFLRKMARV